MAIMQAELALYDGRLNGLKKEYSVITKQKEDFASFLVKIAIDLND
jgi:hypothetical protein